MGNTDNVRRVRPDTDVEAPAPRDDEPETDIEDAFIIETDETTWIKVGDTWVDSSRIITVGPLRNLYDALGETPTTVEGAQEYPEGGVCVQIDSPHSDSQFVIDSTVTVEDVMSLIIEAESTEEGNN